MKPNILRQKAWSPYFVGAAIGVLSWFAFLTVDRPMGVSTAFETTAAFAEQSLLPQVSATIPFFHTNSPQIDWGWMLVIGSSPWLWLVGLTIIAVATVVAGRKITPLKRIASKLER